MARSVTLSGNVRYAAPREAGSHTDRWTALALALEAIDAAPPYVYEYVSSPRRPSLRDF